MLCSGAVVRWCGGDDWWGYEMAIMDNEEWKSADGLVDSQSLRNWGIVIPWER